MDGVVTHASATAAEASATQGLAAPAAASSPPVDGPQAPAFNPKLFRLGDVLVSKGLISAEQLRQALELQRGNGLKLGRALAQLGVISDQQVAQVVAEQLGVAHVDLNRRVLRPEQVQRLTEAQARRHRALVLGPLPDGTLEVALVDAADMVAIDQLARLLKHTLTPAVATEEALLSAIERIYQRQDELAGLASQVAAEVGLDDSVRLLGLEITAGSDDAPIVRLLNSLFHQAVSRQVSDVHIEPQERGLQIRFRIDGVMQVHSTPDARIASAMVQRLKLMAGLDISEKRLPQDGRFRMKVGRRVLDVRLSTLPVQFGESVVMRLLLQDTAHLQLDALAMPPVLLKRLRAALHAQQGLVLVTGPTGSGKTTTLYAALAECNRPEHKIITVEDPVEYRLPGLNQVQVNDKVDLSFARVLRAALRQDPDIILVGEMRDSETAEIGLRAAITGHLVLSSLHTTSAAATPLRLRDMGVPPHMVAMGLRLVIAQRLVCTLCPQCAGGAAPTPREHEWLAETAAQAQGPQLDAKMLPQARGCTSCHQTGYAGRQAVYDLLEMTPELVQLASQDRSADFALAAHQQHPGLGLRVGALALVAQGRTTLAEAMRVDAGV